MSEVMDATTSSTRTEIVKASELTEKVFEPLMEIQYGHLREKYENDLATYEKLLAANLKQGGVGEVEQKQDTFSYERGRLGIYFVSKETGLPQFVPRPKPPSVSIFQYNPRRKVDDIWKPAGGWGLLANPTLNREIRIDRVEKYETEMAEGKWVTLLSDPITITPEGHVTNGQHRLAAAHFVTTQKRWMNDPEFLVVWGVDPMEALYADGSHRTAVDEKTIAVKLVKR